MDNKRDVQVRSAKTKLRLENPNVSSIKHDDIEGIIQNTLLGARLTREMFNRISCKRCASNKIQCDF